MAVVINLLESV